ncbi:MAG TPA: ROK family protein [Candidatus Saccharimonadales bacterium]|nr:ROK family protein [Candidatus Saccharimonadales bacterium]
MYVGIDIGGTKTLIAVLDENGVIVEQQKIPTNPDYDTFLSELENVLASFKNKEFAAGGIGLPATVLDREHGRAKFFGNLPWKNIPIHTDMERLCGCPVAIENDAKLAALSEYMLLKDKFGVVLYVTISTGIGYGLVNKARIDTDIGDGGGRTILLEHHGKMTPWEDFASGRAIVERFGKLAKDIDDSATWKIISHDLAKGFIELIAVTQPEAIVIGGSVGQYFGKFKKFLEEDIKQYHVPLIKLPVLLQAQRPELAVAYGCYDIAKQTFPDAKILI